MFGAVGGVQVLLGILGPPIVFREKDMLQILLVAYCVRLISAIPVDLFTAAADASELSPLTSGLTLEIEEVLARLPQWDPLLAVGGDANLRAACSNEIDRYCSNTLPIGTCLNQSLGEVRTSISDNAAKLGFSEACWQTLRPCHQKEANHVNTVDDAFSILERAEQCFYSLTFRNVLTAGEVQEAERILYAIDWISRRANISYYVGAGNAIGSLHHHTRIPWDDDLDVFVPRWQIPTLLKLLTSIEGSPFKVTKYSGNHKQNFNITFWKVFDAKKPVNLDMSAREGFSWNISHPQIRYPYVDIFSITCSELSNECHEEWGITLKENWLFPTIRRPFGRLSLSFPRDTKRYVREKYGEQYHCMTTLWDHRHEKLRSPGGNMIQECSKLPFYPVFTAEMERGLLPDDSMSVEHLMDGNTRLATVVFDRNGNEVRRSFADGLVGANGVTSFSHPFSEPDGPLPFLPVERFSYYQNAANRSLKVLNMEVLPMMSRVQISNSSSCQNSFAECNIVENTDLKVVSATSADKVRKELQRLRDLVVDVVICFQMDWGMARSGNIHAAREFAMDLDLSYAYSIELLNLNDTANKVGYVGIALFSLQWCIIRSSLVRFDYLSHKSNENVPWLGAPIALLVMLKHGDGSILFVAVSGTTNPDETPRYRSNKDCMAVCDEIRRNYRTASTIYLVEELPGASFGSQMQTVCSDLKTL